MRTGEMRQWVKFLRNTHTQSATTGDVQSNETVYTETWAKVTPLSGSRAMIANQLSNTQGYDIVTRWQFGITTDMVIEWKGKRLTIHSVVDQEAGERVLNILAFEVS